MDAVFVGDFVVLVDERGAAVRVVNLMDLVRRAERADVDVRRRRHGGGRLVVVARPVVRT